MISADKMNQNTICIRPIGTDYEGKAGIGFKLISTLILAVFFRYGGVSFGHVLNTVPEDFGVGASETFRKIAVRHVSKVRSIGFLIHYERKSIRDSGDSQAWYNHKGFHSMPIYLNVLNNAILRAALPMKKGNPAAYGITLINHPMEGTNARLSQEKM